MNTDELEFANRLGIREKEYKEKTELAHRGLQYVMKHSFCNIQADVAIANAHIAGATEQRDIDIDKACEWLKDFNHTYLEELGVGINTRLVIEDFRKAMKGE